MNKFVYFVSFIGIKDFKEAKGYAEVPINKQITNIDEIKAIAKTIENKFKIEEVTINNFILLRQEKT